MQKICFGSGHALGLTTTGKVYSWGGNNDGQLGLGDKNDRLSPILIQRLTNIVGIFAGSSNSFAITDKNEVYAWGRNREDQLGLAILPIFTAPELIRDLNNIVQISSSGHTLALTNNGQVYCCGSNDDGELGLGDNANREFFVLSTNLNNIIQVETGFIQSFVLTSSGTVYAFGSNQSDSLGLSDSRSINSTGRGNKNVPTLISYLKDIIQISSRSQHALALDIYGQVHVWGNPLNGGLGVEHYGSPPKIIPEFSDNKRIIKKEFIQIIEINTGYDHSLLLSKDGKIYTFGKNMYGQLGARDTVGKSIPTYIANINNL